MRRAGVAIVAAAVAVVMCGCGSGAAQRAAEAEASASASASAARQQAADACLDVWLNTLAPKSTIDAGLQPVDDGQTTYPPVVTQNANGYYHGDHTVYGFDVWVEANEVPWPDIEASIYYGNGCPYQGKA
ncbi:MAG: hypothetical protein FWF36_09385 [Propionibacteriaceae bacterium]|nr:hypothetical protein [Propionibacteriaceae bacterium]